MDSNEVSQVEIPKEVKHRKINTACGCIAYPTIWTILGAVGLSLIILFIAKLTYRNSK